MATGIEKMAAQDTLIEEVDNILWKYVYDILSQKEIKDCLDKALKNHICNLKQVGITLLTN